MFRMLIVAPLLALLLAACVVAPADRYGYGGVVVAPALPVVVEIGPEPYYYQSGFYYFYNNDRWSYARSRSGPWMDLPRSHYPKEIRHRGGPDDRGRGEGRGWGRGEDRDR